MFLASSSRILVVKSLLILDISFPVASLQYSSFLFQSSYWSLRLVLRRSLIDFSNTIIFSLLPIYFWRFDEWLYCSLIKFFSCYTDKANLSSVLEGSEEEGYKCPFFLISSFKFKLSSFNIFSFSSLRTITFLFIYLSFSSAKACILCNSLS